MSYPNSSTANATSVGASSTSLPAFALIANTYNGAEGTLNATITAGSPGASVSGGQYQFVYYLAGQAYQDTASDTSPGAYANGPIINVANQANLTLANAAAPPAVSGAIDVLSVGANGYPETAGTSQAAIYNAGFGGQLTVTNSGSITVTGNTTSAGAGAPWQPFMSGIYAESVGGNGAGAKNNDNDFAGNGGNGGGIIVNTTAGSQIVLQGSGSTGAPITGIAAYSDGGGPGCRCSGDVANTYGYSGMGGTIAVDHAGSITSTAANSIGIVAISVGGDGGLSTGHGVGSSPGTSGSGGPVGVTLENNASISLSNGNGIAILAASSVGLSVNAPLGNGVDGPISGGPVSVTISNGASIASTGNGTFNIGVAAISTGSPNILQPFAPASTVTANGSGYSGSVTVTNNGTITTSGQLAIGVAALSLGGAGVFTTAGSGTSYLGNAGSASLNNTCRSTCPQVVVTNGETITTNGASAFGILAAYNGAGGLINVASNATTSTGASGKGNNNTWSSGAFIGGQTSSNNGNGGTVQVINSGAITTGNGSGGGKLAIGILAQSVGGGGGSSGGSGVAALIGDSGGTGGSGGSVSVTANAGSNIATFDDGAIGILAQSIGGGGGNGGNAAGVFVATGGQGGDGGSGGSVDTTLNSSGSLTTSGDFAAGVIAQSVGGGGGNGGFGTSGGLFIDVAIGGGGGGGGNGGQVTLTNTQTIMTSGQDSLGVLAQSVGGGGGNGGAATAYSVGVAFSSSIALGGTGGSGGSGGQVTVNNNYHITTTGPDAIGIIAQSIGGGGGTGGASTAKSLAIGVPDLPTITFTASLGASGGGGGGGGLVTINNAGQIITSGDGAHGLLAQSIGAGGGNGGDSTAAGHAIESSSGTVQLSVALGASGGVGGTAGDVTVNNGSSPTCGGCVSQIQTGGNDAAGIAAQSIGGGGGNSTAGNASVGSPNVGGTTGSSLGLTFSLGASAGAGGAGNVVNVTNDSGNTIVTAGSGSPGILAQSIGGGGGDAGGGSSGASENNLSINVSVGGNAGSGSTGGLVTVTNGGPITTSGGDSVGILAQSIGGGGGVAGSTDASASITAAGQAEDIINVPSSDSYSGNISIGGKGGSGAYANTVTVGNTGPITTYGERAYGIEAQSIGGGGGNGGAATSTSNGSTNDTYSSSVTVGGGGGGVAGNGGQISVTSSGAISTAGYNSDGILAQSIGGGGGVGGDGSVTANTTLGIGIGASGSGSAGGTAGNVSVTTSAGGTITTLGDDALGILAQSIGGGGGTGTAGCTNSASAGLPSEKATACFGNTNVSASTNGPADFWPREDYSLNVGGGTGASGNGDNVAVTVGNAIITTGARAMGVVAQSIGGGGGYAAGAAQTLSGTGLANNPGSSGSTGGPVTVTVAASGSIATSGVGAWGILAQSVGGGGGFSGDPSLPLLPPVSNTLSRTGSGNAFANTVSVTVDGNITTTGTNAHGIVAQAIGGSGGIVAGCCNSTTAFALGGNSAQVRGTSNASYWGDGGAINITQGAGSTISTSGSGSIGIFAQSSGNTAAVNAISVTIGGSVIGGTNSGVTEGVRAAGILLSGGGNDSNPNTITINSGGSVSTVDGVNGTAILSNDGTTNVVNNGTITGSIITDPSTIVNFGVLNTGSTLVASSVTNSGTMNIYGYGTIGTTRLTGNFIQTSSGVLATDVDVTAPQTADLLSVSGNAQVGGRVVTTAAALLPGSYTVLTANSLNVTGEAEQALVFKWKLGASGTNLLVTPSSNFTPEGISLSSSQASSANYLTNAWNNADPSFAKKFGYLSQLPSPARYAAVLSAFSARGTQALPTAMANSAGTLLGTAMGCPVFVDQGTLLGEDSCAWAKFTGQWTNQGSTGGDPGYDVDSTTYRLGGQKEVAPDWFLGGSLATGVAWGQQGASSSHGDTYDGSVAVKHTIGSWLFAGSFAIASGSFHHNRLVELPLAGTAAGYNAVLQSDSSLLLAGGRLRAAYDFAFGNSYVRPYGDLDVIYTHTPGFQESGQRGVALAIGASDKTSVVLSPMIEFGGRYNIDQTTILRPYAAIGVSFLPSNTRTVDASFVGGSAADGTFQTFMKSPSVLGNLDVGAQLYRVGGFEVKAEYTLRVGDSLTSQGASARVAFHF